MSMGLYQLIVSVSYTVKDFTHKTVANYGQCRPWILLSGYILFMQVSSLIV